MHALLLACWEDCLSYIFTDITRTQQGSISLPLQDPHQGKDSCVLGRSRDTSGSYATHPQAEDADRGVAKGLVEAIAAGRAATAELLLRTQAGGHLWAQIAITPVRSEYVAGGTDSVVGVLKDVSARRSTAEVPFFLPQHCPYEDSMCQLKAQPNINLKVVICMIRVCKAGCMLDVDVREADRHPCQLAGTHTAACRAKVSVAAGMLSVGTMIGVLMLVCVARRAGHEPVRQGAGGHVRGDGDHGRDASRQPHHLRQRQLLPPAGCAARARRSCILLVLGSSPPSVYHDGAMICVNISQH